jgi:hypothetical protein
VGQRDNRGTEAVSKHTLPPLPETTYQLGVYGDGYSEDRIYGLAGYSDEHMEAYATEAVRLNCAELVAVLTEAADHLAELYAKYQTKIGPFASQSQRINVKARAIIAKFPGEPK